VSTDVNAELDAVRIEARPHPRYRLHRDRLKRVLDDRALFVVIEPLPCRLQAGAVARPLSGRVHWSEQLKLGLYGPDLLTELAHVLPVVFDFFVSGLLVNFVDTLGTAHTVGSPTGLLQVGQWAHVVATYDGINGTLYVNGTQVAQASLGSFTPQTTYPVNIGRRPSGSPPVYFAGAIGQAAVYKGALTAARVAAHYSAATTVPAYTSAVLADAPVAYYRMNDGGGATTGFGLWPISSTDANGQTTSYAYDALGRETSATLPGEGAGLTTTGTSYTVWCSATGAQSPCVEVDRTQRLDNSTTVTSRAFYDGLGHLVETRSPAPGGQDVVRYSFYDPSQRLAFESVPYFVSAYSGGPGSAAYSIPDSNQAGTTFTYDGLGRTTSSTDALSHRSTTSYSTVCNAPGTDAGCYEQKLSVDRDGHQGGVLGDAFGRINYEQRYTGGSPSTYALYATARYSRGRQVGKTLTVGGASYPVQASYDDAGDVLTRTYPTGEMVSNSYTAQGWLSAVSTQQGTSTTSLLSSASYAGTGGAFGVLTGANLGATTYTYGATYDLLARATDLKVTKSSGGAILFEQARTFDPAGNVASASTTLPAGTDNQSFGYDEQNRLTSASASGLSGAQYSQSFAYDTLGRLTSGPQGGYTYGSSAHALAATAVGSGYTASYDAAGNMTCRAPSSSTTCAGSTPNGAQLSYNAEGQLMGWQGGGVSDQFLYDCQGKRVAQQVTQGGTTTTTVYVGSLEAVTTSGSTTTTQTYYSPAAAGSPLP
jgi:YD repeat-containing protein